MKKTQFVPKSLIYDPKKIVEELEWIYSEMHDTHDLVFNIINHLIEIGEYEKKDIERTKKERDSAMKSLIEKLKKRGTENSLNYSRKLEISLKDIGYTKPGNVNANTFMQSLVTYINEIGTRIHDLEKELKDRTN